jgi:hypothetical protein
MMTSAGARLREKVNKSPLLKADGYNTHFWPMHILAPFEKAQKY